MIAAMTRTCAAIHDTMVRRLARDDDSESPRARVRHQTTNASTLMATSSAPATGCVKRRMVAATVYHRSGSVSARAPAGGVDSARDDGIASSRQVAYTQSVIIAASDVSMYMRASCAKYNSSGESATSAAVSRPADRDSSFTPTANAVGMRAMLANTENARSANAESPTAEIHTLSRMK